MKVICVKDVSNMRDAYGISVKEYAAAYPQEGFTYTVDEITTCTCGCDTKVYKLKEFPNTKWDASAFKEIANFGEVICDQIERELTKEDRYGCE